MKNRYSLLILKADELILNQIPKCIWEMKQHCRNTIFGQGIPQYLNGTMINQFAVKEYRVLTKDTNQMTQFNQCFDIKVQGI